MSSSFPSFANPLIARYRRTGRYFLALSLLLTLFFTAMAILVLVLAKTDETILTSALGLLFLPIVSLIFQRYKLAVQRIGIAPVSPTQFPEVYEITKQVCADAGLAKIPPIFVTTDPAIDPCIQSPGTRPIILIGMDFLSGCRENNTPHALRFMIAHQVAHFVYKHNSPAWIMGCSAVIATPILNTFFRKHCEFSADAWAGLYAPEGSALAMSLCVAGKDNYLFINTQDLASFRRRSRRGLFAIIAYYSALKVSVIERTKRLHSDNLLIPVAPLTDHSELLPKDLLATWQTQYIDGFATK
ncbi:hypothetical protein [Arcanobacterium pinnipediorum]|uniref:Zn-dependent protease with chaperone function n=1 Tax=Arcanobacterium pinnipediorum TaxID=1503041 RepID=A0ABY5AG52_9ACTO|nr:hypothetical protein [Arcanobacterium pinnipediorum]USR79175.1 hypothetical protein NG665_07280 [Arcanobacterium pinnipediorum]